jgi:hypothetical protein
MLKHLGVLANQRRLRLFACACVRRMWHLLTDPRSRKAVEVSEAYADGLTRLQELMVARAEAEAAVNSTKAKAKEGPKTARAQKEPVQAEPLLAQTEAARAACWSADRAVGEAAREAAYLTRRAAALAAGTAVPAFPYRPEAENAETGFQVAAIRDIFYIPFRTPYPQHAWRMWSKDCVVRKVQAIYDERRFQDLPLLADALEEAGCDNAELLNHCRQPGEHVRGCWVVDALLGKG